MTQPGEEVRVQTQDLRRKASQIGTIPWASPLGQTPLVPPDGLELAKTAVKNLQANAAALWQYQSFGEREGERLAESLQSVADAYDKVDLQAMQDLNDGGEPSITPEIPKTNSIPPPTHPAPLGIPIGLSADEYLDVEAAQRALETGDQGASLQEAAAFWRANAQKLLATADTFTTKDLDWEGEAADQAYARFTEYEEWLKSLGGSWNKLADEADRIANAHRDALGKHTGVFSRYLDLKREFQAAAARGGSAARMVALRMEQLQKESEEVRWGYAREGQPDQVQPTDPPKSGVPTIPVTSNGDPRQPAGPTAPTNGQPGPGGGGPQSSGGAPTQGSPAMPTTPSMPSAAQPMAAQSGGTPAGGGAPSGGVPSGGGAPSGGMPGGLPGGGGPPKLPSEPSVKPAAAAGGGGAGAGGGGAGGGAPSTPLSPAVGAETVASSPSGAARGATVAGAAPGAAVGGAMGGGMAPMGHGAGQNQGKEKRRDPAVAPDEELYTEDRPWTEAVIGNRRRKDVQDGKESK